MLRPVNSFRARQSLHAWSPDDDYLAVTDRADGQGVTVRVYESATGQLLCAHTLPLRGQPALYWLGPRRVGVFYSEAAGTMRVYRLAVPEGALDDVLVPVPTADRHLIEAVAPGGEHALVMSVAPWSSFSVVNLVEPRRTWTVERQKLGATLGGEDNRKTSAKFVGFSPDGRSLLATMQGWVVQLGLDGAIVQAVALEDVTEQHAVWLAPPGEVEPASAGYRVAGAQPPAAQVAVAMRTDRSGLFSSNRTWSLGVLDLASGVRLREVPILGAGDDLPDSVDVLSSPQQTRLLVSARSKDFTSDQTRVYLLDSEASRLAELVTPGSPWGWWRWLGENALIECSEKRDGSVRVERWPLEEGGPGSVHECGLPGVRASHTCDPSPRGGFWLVGEVLRVDRDERAFAWFASPPLAPGRPGDDG